VFLVLGSNSQLGVQLTTTLTSAYGAWQVREILDGV